jgi:hypothetical protein
MHGQVQCNWNPRDRRVAHELSVTQQSRRGMMVRVQEGQGLLLNHQENSVDQFNVLGYVIKLWTLATQHLRRAERSLLT